jgi:iron complex outermembrane recepter protein
VLFDRIERRRIECAQPQDYLRLGAHWATTHFGVDVNESRYGAFCSFTLSPSDDQEYAAKWLTDVQASYRLGPYRLAIGAQNVFEA